MRSVTNREWKEKGAESREGCQTHNTHNEHVVVWQGGGLHSALMHLSKTHYVEEHAGSSQEEEL